MEIAQNQEGKQVARIGNDWRPIDQTAVNDKGEKAYLIDGGWLSDKAGDTLNALKATPQLKSNSLLEQATSKETLPIWGSIIGGVLGSVAGPAGSAILGGALGTALGTSIGTSAKQLTEQAKGEVKSTQATLGEQVHNVAEQSLWNAVGSAVWSGAAKLLGGLMPTARSGAEAAQAALKAQGGSLSASQFFEGGGLPIELGESLARAGAGGKGQFFRMDKANADALQAIKTTLVSNISKAPIDDRVAGKLFQSAIEKGDAAHQVAAAGMYKALDDRLNQFAGLIKSPGAASGMEMVSSPVTISQTKAAVKSVVDRYAEIGATVAPGGGQAALVNLVGKANPEMSFGAAQTLRSEMLAKVRDLERSANPDSKALGLAKRLSQTLSEDMDTSASKLSPDIYKQYRDVSEFYKKGKDAFNNEVVQSLLTTDASKVGNQLFKDGSVEGIIQAKASLRQAALADKSVNMADTMSKLKAGYLEGVLTGRNMVNKEGETTAQNLAKMLAQSGGETPLAKQKFAVIFNEQERRNITEFGRTAYLVLQNKPAAFGILAPLLQAGAVGKAIEGTARLADVGLLFAPAALGKLLSTPTAVQWATKAVEYANKDMSQQAGAAVAKALAAMQENP